MQINQSSTSTQIIVQRPIQNLYINAKSYLPTLVSQSHTINQIDKKFQNVVDECDKIVIETAKKVKQKRAQINKYVKNIKGLRYYLNQISQKIFNELNSKLDQFIQQYQQKENSIDVANSNSVKTQNKGYIQNAKIIIQKSGKLNKLITSKITKGFSECTKFTGRELLKLNIVKNMQKNLKKLYLETRIIYNVIFSLVSQTLEKQLNLLKLGYQQSKNSVVMLINYKINSQEMKEKIMKAFENLRGLKVTIAEKILEIKVDREFLLQNFKQICMSLIQIMKMMIKIGENNLKCISNNSRELYCRIIRNYKVQKILLTDHPKRLGK